MRPIRLMRTPGLAAGETVVEDRRDRLRIHIIAEAGRRQGDNLRTMPRILQFPFEHG